LSSVVHLKGVAAKNAQALQAAQNAQTVTMVLNVIVTALIMLVALGLGLWLRRLLVRRLQKTVLDSWVTQTFGVIVVLIPLIVGASGVLAIWSADTFRSLVLLLLGTGAEIRLFGYRLAVSLLLFALAIGVARTIKNLTVRGLGDKRVDVNMRTLFGRIFYILTLTIAGFWVLSLWQVPLNLPVTVLSVLTVAISFSIQDILKDLVAGFYILLERPFYIGDQISITTAPTVVYAGKVEDVQLRATKIRLITGEEATIPNSMVFSGAVVNNTFYGDRRSTILVMLPQDDFTKDATIASIVNALKEQEHIMPKPEPLVLFTGYAGEKIQLTVRFWVASGQVIDLTDVMHMLHELLPTADLAIHEPLGAA
jgi:small-conductance mechanosensitive channel